jgi:hypothetical protein
MTAATAKFHDSDHWGTLFPMETNRLMIQHHSKEISEYIYEKIFNDAHPSDCFLPQQRVFATKPRGHLRRTVKLDPIAEFFLYDVALRNKGIFRKSVSDARASFGYRFVNGEQISVSSAYKEFKNRVAECKSIYKHHIKFDIASYFNSLYHHDVTHWFSANDSVSEKDKIGVGKFMREINSGRSTDFMPQGIYPAKMIGSEFLKFIDFSGQIKSAVTLRFMDDFHLFDDSEVTLNQDFIRIQQLLGSKALNINPSKTMHDDQSHDVSRAQGYRIKTR